MYYNGCFFTKNPSQALSGKRHLMKIALRIAYQQQALSGNADDADVSERPGFTMQWAKGSGNAAVSRIGPCGPCLQFLPENGFTRGT